MKRWFYWLCVLVWASFMFTLSTDTFSSHHTLGIVVRIFHSLFPFVSLDTLDVLNLLVRKCAHISEYFVFSSLLLLAIRGDEPGWKLRWAVFAIVVATAYAGLDEFHQSFVPSRTASPWDVSLDAVGASLAQIAWWLAAKRGGRTSAALRPMGSRGN